MDIFSAYMESLMKKLKNPLQIDCFRHNYTQFQGINLLDGTAGRRAPPPPKVFFLSPLVTTENIVEL